MINSTSIHRFRMNFSNNLKDIFMHLVLLSFFFDVFVLAYRNFFLQNLTENLTKWMK